MAYKILPGIQETELPALLDSALEKYGYYKGNAVNYSKANVAPIVMCLIVCNDEILLLKRGYGLADANGYWSIITGFIDEKKPVNEVALQEAKEELSLRVGLEQIKVGRSYTLKNDQEKRSYIVFPCLISLTKKPDIILDREHTDYAWIKKSDLGAYHILDDLPYAIDYALSLR